MIQDTPERRAAFEQCVRDKLENAPGCHDFAHTMRVVRNAELILRAEQPEHPFAVWTAAVFHDFARPEELAADGKLDHAKLGAELVRDELKRFGCDEAFIDLVSSCVRTHRYRGNVAPETLEAKIVYDADKLDSTGAFGVARAFHFAGRIGACLDNSEEEAVNSPAYGKNDSAYREYLVKLRHLPGKMLTETGRAIALERGAFMDAFFRQLKSEAGER